MHVHVRVGGVLVSRLGRDRLALEVAGPVTVGGVMRRLGEMAPGTHALLARALAVVDGRHVPMDRPLADGDEVAFLLPIQGG